MGALTLRSLQDGPPFGIQVSGVDRASVRDDSVRKQLVALFEKHGVIVFEGLEQSTEMQVELSNVFGPLEDHPLKQTNKHVDDTLPGVIDMETKPGEATVIEVEGTAFS